MIKQSMIESSCEQKLVMFSGYKNSGKDYFANLLYEYAKNEYGSNIYKLSIASGIKQLYSYFRRVSLEDIEIEKNNPASNVRKDLQNLGDALKKVFGTDILTEQVLQNIDDIENRYQIQNGYNLFKPIYLVTDWRLQQEFMYFEDYINKVIRVRIVKSDLVTIDNHITENDLTDEMNCYDYVIYNDIKNLDVNNLPNNIKNIFDEILSEGE